MSDEEFAIGDEVQSLAENDEWENAVVTDVEAVGERRRYTVLYSDGSTSQVIS